jgi:signal peptidase I
VSTPDPSPVSSADPSLDPAVDQSGAAIDSRTDADETESDEHPVRATVRAVVEWVVVIGGALLAAFLIKTFLFQAFYIPSESMEPTLIDRDRVVVNKVSYRLHDVNRGDLVVFDRPPAEPVTQIDELIKRVIGLPGETVEARDGSIYIDGRRLEEPYLADGEYTHAFGPVTVADEQVFVMGDNRGNSRDSRVFGPIDEDLIVGRAFVRVWPVNRLAFL